MAQWLTVPHFERRKDAQPKHDYRTHANHPESLSQARTHQARQYGIDLVGVVAPGVGKAGDVLAKERADRLPVKAVLQHDDLEAIRWNCLFYVEIAVQRRRRRKINYLAFTFAEYLSTRGGP